MPQFQSRVVVAVHASPLMTRAAQAVVLEATLVVAAVMVVLVVVAFHFLLNELKVVAEEAEQLHGFQWAV